MTWIEFVEISSSIAPIIREVIILAVAVTGAIVAIIGLNTWKHQLKGTRRLEAKHDVMISL